MFFACFIFPLDLKLIYTVVAVDSCDDRRTNISKLLWTKENEFEIAETPTLQTEHLASAILLCFPVTDSYSGFVLNA